MDIIQPYSQRTAQQMVNLLKNEIGIISGNTIEN